MSGAIEKFQFSLPRLPPRAHTPSPFVEDEEEKFVAIDEEGSGDGGEDKHDAHDDESSWRDEEKLDAQEAEGFEGGARQRKQGSQRCPASSPSHR